MKSESLSKPLLDKDLADAIAAWVRHVPDHVLIELAVVERRNQAAAFVGEIIVPNMTKRYPGLVNTSAPPLRF